MQTGNAGFRGFWRAPVGVLLLKSNNNQEGTMPVILRIMEGTPPLRGGVPSIFIRFIGIVPS
jgi:hypothetical protein